MFCHHLHHKPERGRVLNFRNYTVCLCTNIIYYLTLCFCIPIQLNTRQTYQDNSSVGPLELLNGHVFSNLHIPQKCTSLIPGGVGKSVDHILQKLKLMLLHFKDKIRTNTTQNKCRVCLRMLNFELSSTHTLWAKITDVGQVYRHLGSSRNWDYRWTEWNRCW